MTFRYAKNIKIGMTVHVDIHEPEDLFETREALVMAITTMPLSFGGDRMVFLVHYPDETSGNVYKEFGYVDHRSLSLKKNLGF